MRSLPWPDGEGNGPAAVAFNPKPASFHNPKIWEGDKAKKIKNAVKNGKGQMVPLPLSDAEIKAVIDYISQTFKKEENRSAFNKITVICSRPVSSADSY